MIGRNQPENSSLQGDIHAEGGVKEELSRRGVTTKKEMTVNVGILQTLQTFIQSSARNQNG